MSQGQVLCCLAQYVLSSGTSKHHEVLSLFLLLVTLAFPDIFFFFLIFIWLCQVLIVTPRRFDLRCSTRNLVPWPEVETRPCIGNWSLATGPPGKSLSLASGWHAGKSLPLPWKIAFWQFWPQLFSFSFHTDPKSGKESFSEFFATLFLYNSFDTKGLWDWMLFHSALPTSPQLSALPEHSASLQFRVSLRFNLPYQTCPQSSPGFHLPY